MNLPLSSVSEQPSANQADNREIVHQRKRILGSYYTPDGIAAAVVAMCHLPVDHAGFSGMNQEEGRSRYRNGRQSATHDDSRPLLDSCRFSPLPIRVLDPACGDGAFLLAWLQSQEQPGLDRLELVKDSVFGVDIDPIAIDGVRTRIAEWIGNQTSQPQNIRTILAKNLIWGDSLLGEDWTESSNSHSVEGVASSNDTARPEVDWNVQFSQIALEGGFDLILGNPPYRREKNAKTEFDRIAKSSLGRRWRRARMDLWHYFLHRGLDLLKPNGVLSYVVNSYWTQSTSGRSLVQRLAESTTMEHVLLFGNAKLFRGVSGRHMVFQLRKGCDESTRCRVIDFSNVPAERISSEIVEALRDVTHDRIRLVSQTELWHRGTMSIDKSIDSVSLPENSFKLSDLFEVRQGIAENPPFITKSMAAELADPTLIGQGVFVLTDDEINRLDLTDKEMSLLRPYYVLRSIDRFTLAAKPSHHILYLTPSTAPTIDVLPQIKTHLGRFRATLERRREVREGKIPWWVLHWPRQERLFVEPRILCIQMGARPRFVFAAQPTFVGFSVNVIVNSRQPTEISSKVPSALTLEAMTAVLNSTPARNWFQVHAKKRGVNLDISGITLRDFPVPSDAPSELVLQLEAISRNWKRASLADSGQIETTLDELVQKLYGIE